MWNRIICSEKCALWVRDLAANVAGMYPKLIVPKTTVEHRTREDRVSAIASSRLEATFEVAVIELEVTEPPVSGTGCAIS